MNMETNLLYRAKSPDGIWYYGIPIRGKMYVDDVNFVNIDPTTIGQFIGRCDMYGVKIFDGDIISINGGSPKVVRFRPDKCCFCLADVDSLKSEPYWDIWVQPDYTWWNENVTILGNIYDKKQ